MTLSIISKLKIPNFVSLMQISPLKFIYTTWFLFLNVSSQASLTQYMQNGAVGLLLFLYHMPQICSFSSPSISISSTTIHSAAQVEYACHVWLFLLLCFPQHHQIHQQSLSPCATQITNPSNHSFYDDDPHMLSVLTWVPPWGENSMLTAEQKWSFYKNIILQIQSRFLREKPYTYVQWNTNSFLCWWLARHFRA